MAIILNPISPAAAARESKALDHASKRILDSPKLRGEFLKKLGFKVSKAGKPASGETGVERLRN